MQHITSLEQIGTFKIGVMLSSNSSPLRHHSSPRMTGYVKPQFSFSSCNLDDSTPYRSGVEINCQNEFPSPDFSSAFRSPQASIERQTIYYQPSPTFTLGESNRMSLSTPKVSREQADLVLEGKSLEPLPEPLNTLRYLFPFLAFISFFLLFFIPPFAFVFFVSIIGIIVVESIIRKNNKKRLKQIPNLRFPTPRR